MKRQIIKIDENLCNGCGACVPNCAEGALQIVDGKARLISDLFCDGLGACIGHCPLGAITFEEREAEKYDERKTMAENIVPAGENTIIVHLKHMLDHNEIEYYNQAVEYLKEIGMENPLDKEKKEEEKKMEIHKHHGGGCPGSKMMDFRKNESPKSETVSTGEQPSELQQWPVQLHLVSPHASYFKGADVVLAADCVAFAMGNFHRDYLKGKALAIACPKLDTGKEMYIEKITSMIDDAKINMLIVMRMEVPCCGGLVSLAKEGVAKATRKVPVKEIVVGIQGNIISEEWI